MDPKFLAIAVIGSNAVALVILLACWRWPVAGRLLYVAMFAWAGPWNLYCAWNYAEKYLDYAQWVVLDVYRAFILGPFARHVPLYVSTIAAGQIAIALLLAGRGQAVRLGLAGAMVFLAAITPLGLGSGFPFTLITLWAALLLWRQPGPASLPVLLWRKLRRVS